MCLRHQNRGFSFVELLVVLVIGSVLYVMALGPVRAYLDAKKVTQCTENLRKLYLVMSLYANEHGGAFPKAEGAKHSSEVFTRMVPKYSSEPAIFTCPASKTKKGYTIIAGLTKEDTAPLLADGAAFHGQASGNVLLTDGSILHFEPGAQRFGTLPSHAQVLEPNP